MPPTPVKPPIVASAQSELLEKPFRVDGLHAVRYQSLTGKTYVNAGFLTREEALAHMSSPVLRGYVNITLVRLEGK